MTEKTNNATLDRLMARVTTDRLHDILVRHERTLDAWGAKNAGTGVINVDSVKAFTADFIHTELRALLAPEAEAMDREREALTTDRNTYRTLANIGAWHNDCRPNRHQAARELQKSQAVIDKLADEISALNTERDALRDRLAQVEKNANGDDRAEVLDKVSVVFHGAHGLPAQRLIARTQVEDFLTDRFTAIRFKLAQAEQERDIARREVAGWMSERRTFIAHAERDALKLAQAEARLARVMATIKRLTDEWKAEATRNEAEPLSDTEAQFVAYLLRECADDLCHECALAPLPPSGEGEEGQ